ncbi:MAG: alpha/beta fold hydrolase [Aureispira sp.]|nr:alpha/beta fold hydrolase [Aureispira sp.]
MHKILGVLFIITTLFSTTMNAQKEVVGYWKGKLELPAMSLRIAFTITEEDGKLSSTMDSPDQGAFGIPCTDTKFENGKLTIDAKNLGINYVGTPEGEKMNGKFKQATLDLDLNLERSEKKEGREAKPQDPQEPFNYIVENIYFDNTEANLKLAGTLTLPKTKELAAVAIMISGSGAQDRDESLLGHKPFWVIADHLTNEGIAVLRFDDRGVGESTGKFSGATSADFATDVKAAIAYLKKRKDIDPKKIGLIGHSEGGLIAPMVAADNGDVAFIICMAGPGMAGKDLLPDQVRLIAEANGAGKEDVDKSYKATKKACALVAKEKDVDKLKTKLRKVFEADAEEDQTPEQVDAAISQYSSAWFRYFMKYNPQNDLKKVTCPVLAINGSLDLQVPADDNLEGIAKALKKAKNKDFTTKKLDNLNHLFQNCTTGSPSEYAGIKETIAPSTLKLMSEWINKRF